MSDDERRGEAGTKSGAPSASGVSGNGRSSMPLPGLIAIALYLLLLSVVIVIGVVGRHYPLLFLALPVFLLAACGGLLMLFRWAWAMTLAAVLMLGGYNTWIFMRMHFGAALVQGMLNLVFFFYLVRTEVREKLR